MHLTGFYPVITSADVAAAAAFYRETLGFETTYESDWYVSLRLDRFELAILDAGHDTIPEGFRRSPQGVLLNVEVDDVDAVHAALTGRFADRLRLALRDEDFGQRHFILEAPDGVLLDVIQPIPPSAEFAAAYADGEAPA
ncbi:VOC family protein [Agromyces aerolatus]|uniref:VOC family protein n=1 Tax=Agromyces sp. LY-1074 TaxID=3074080 RepID=UPI00285AA60C|nr:MULTISPECIES: VOC family protein [unclassified Agromyces]MDR5701841.1 glyoxalase [Agromyces sp. LY-1074]MDR5708086.1 glyoxalase [Agromyces sp. LY-1358]